MLCRQQQLAARPAALHGGTHRVSTATPRCSVHLPQARKLEGDLDIKVAAYGKLCSGYEYGYARGESGLATDQVGWLG